VGAPRRANEGVETEAAGGAEPAGAARAAASAPILPPAPPRLSMTKDAPRMVDILAAMMRTIVSLAPPAGVGEISLMGRAGEGSPTAACPAGAEAIKKTRPPPPPS